MKRTGKIRRFLALAAAAALALTACGPKAAAATMHLRRAEGAVAVADGAGRQVEPREALGLYSGYQVDTQSESYAWIDLDEVKLTKMDQNSGIQIQKEGKRLEILVNSGSLFFNVTQPLAEDEAMEIRTSSMVVGIRGTCGWVEAEDAQRMSVYLLEGEVECTAGGQTVTVSAGEMVELTPEPAEPLTVRPFTAAQVKPFVQEEAEPKLLEELPEEEAREPFELPAAQNGAIELNGEIIYQDIVVPDGENLMLADTEIYGDLYTNTGGIRLTNSTIHGNIQAGSGGVGLTGSTVNGNIQVESGGVGLTSSTVTGSIQVESGGVGLTDSNVAGDIRTGTGGIGVAGSTVTGRVEANSPDNVEIHQSTVNGQWYE